MFISREKLLYYSRIQVPMLKLFNLVNMTQEPQKSRILQKIKNYTKT